ncbi:exosporium protein D [Bacillus sp. RO2]|uniref:exosporium protein D n=1 Tax=Bacillus sp. RO2 TaxID=2723913 RepID=UPI00145DF044|nr:exosporium protein D [Bacillus sp. RO2]NMH71707.1 exosporium protein D [Bacillus sp. RO2]
MIRKYSMKSDLTDLPGPSPMVNSMKSRIRECKPKNFVETHKFQGVGENETGNIPLTFIINAAQEYVLFEDFTENHNKTYFQIGSPTLGTEDLAFNLQVRVTTDSSETPLEYTIPLSQTRAFQLENVRRITVHLNNLPIFFQRRISFYLEKTFCMSCSEGGMENGM